METTIEKLIKDLPVDSIVLDVGTGGAIGDNTTNYLRKRFKHLTGFNIKPEVLEKYLKFHPGINCVLGDFYSYDFSGMKYDLVVLDLNLPNNVLNDWPHSIKNIVPGILKPGGHVICFIMATTEYGDKEDEKLLNDHLRNFWGLADPETGTAEFFKERLEQKFGDLYEVVAVEREERRSQVYWVKLRLCQK